MKTLLALNWKMNKTPSEARSWAHELSEKYEPVPGVELAVMAPALSLSVLAANLPAGVGFGVAGGAGPLEQCHVPRCLLVGAACGRRVSGRWTRARRCRGRSCPGG